MMKDKHLAIMATGLILIIGLSTVTGFLSVDVTVAGNDMRNITNVSGSDGPQRYLSRFSPMEQRGQCEIFMHKQ